MAKLLICALAVAAVAAGCGESSTPPRGGASARGISVEVFPESARSGDEIEIWISAPDGITWGLETILESEDSDGWAPISWLVAEPGGRTAAKFVASKRGQVPLIGFRGRGVVRAIVPKIAPGDYRLSKEFILGGNSTTTTFAHAHFEVKE